MVIGIGVDIAKVSRFERWVKNPALLHRFFNEREVFETKPADGRKLHSLCEHYAARFCAKEAFSKALGVGISGFELADVYIENDDLGAPKLCVVGSAKKALDDFLLRVGKSSASLHASLSHEREFAVALVIIEGGC